MTNKDYVLKEGRMMIFYFKVDGSYMKLKVVNEGREVKAYLPFEGEDYTAIKEPHRILVKGESLPYGDVFKPTID